MGGRGGGGGGGGEVEGAVGTGLEEGGLVEFVGGDGGHGFRLARWLPGRWCWCV